MKIVTLAERPEFAAQVAAWGFDEWGHLNAGQTRDSRLADVRREMNVDRVPVTFVALADDDRIVGTSALIFDDLDGDPRNPWLASVFVPAEQRGKGIASALVRAVEEKARALGYPRLYLFTTSADALYARLGWQPLERRDYRGEHIQVMSRVL